MQGTNTSEDSFQIIFNHPNFIAIGSASDENDRYSKTIHPSYEFKIPIELFERSDNYGFFLNVYDHSADKSYSWPGNSTSGLTISASPSIWGDIISPDKSLPELNLPILVFTIMIISIILLQNKTKALKWN